MPASFISLGGNTGDVFHAMQRGLSLLDLVTGIRVTEVSPAYETEPVGPARDTVFLNAAARLECELLPRDLLAQLQVVEDRLGRIRDSRWGLRTLDLDLLLHGDAVLASPTLTLPHPHLWYRRFVLDPLSDIAADVKHPCFGESIGDLRELLLLRPFPVILVGASLQQRTALAEHLRSRFPEGSVMVDIATNPALPPAAITLDISSGPKASEQGPSPSAASRSIEPTHSRHVRLNDLPGSMFEAAASALTAILDEPTRHNRPLRRMP